MGQGCSHQIPKDDLNALLETTNFKSQELKRWYSKFIKDYPSGQLNMEQFLEMYGKIYRVESAGDLAAHIFRSFDKNHDNSIDFRELMSSLSVASRGTVREKLEWAFNIYDLDGNGSINKEEILSIVKSMQATANAVEEAKVSDQEISDIFETMDENHDGNLSLEEFIAGVEQHPNFVKMLNGMNR